MILHRSIFVAALAVAAVAPAAALDHSIENGYVDVRLGYTFAKPSYDETVSGGTDESFHWKNVHRGYAEVIGSPAMKPYGGLLLGVSLAVDARDRNDDINDAKLEYRAWYGRLHVGYGIPIGNAAILELVPFGGLGITEARRNGDKSQDTLIVYGGEVALPITLGRHFQFGPQVGYEVSDSETSIRTGNGTSADQHFKDGYFTYSIFVGIRL